jgi:GNAT superfamily N-acetyltransferase
MFRKLIEKILGRIISPFYQTAMYFIAVRSLVNNPAKERIGSDRPDIRYILAEDYNILKMQLGEDVAKRLCARIKSSAGFAFYLENRIAGYLWCTREPIQNEGTEPFYLYIYPKRGMVYMYDWVTLPDYRGRGVMSALVEQALREYEKLGVKSAFYLYSSKNQVMSVATDKFGFKVCGSVEYRRFLWNIRENTSDLYNFSEIN